MTHKNDNWQLYSSCFFKIIFTHNVQTLFRQYKINVSGGNILAIMWILLWNRVFVMKSGACSHFSGFHNWHKRAQTVPMWAQVSHAVQPVHSTAPLGIIPHGCILKMPLNIKNDPVHALQLYVHCHCRNLCAAVQGALWTAHKWEWTGVTLIMCPLVGAWQSRSGDGDSFN